MMQTAVLSVALGLATVYIIKTALFPVSNKTRKAKKVLSSDTTADSDDIVLYSKSRVCPQASPFVAKVELFLKHQGLKFTTKNFTDAPSASGKMPHISFRGEIVNDSHFIIQRLCKDLNIKLDQNLTDEQKAMSNMMKRTMENFLYYMVLRERWLDNYEATKNTVFSSTPWIFREVIMKVLIRPNVWKQLHGTGCLRYAEGQYEQLAEETIDSLSVLLGNKKYFFGDEINSIDYTMFGFLACAYVGKTISPIACEMLSKHKNLVEYVERIKNEFYPSTEFAPY